MSTNNLSSSPLFRLQQLLMLYLFFFARSVSASILQSDENRFDFLTLAKEGCYVKPDSKEWFLGAKDFQGLHLPMPDEAKPGVVVCGFENPRQALITRIDYERQLHLLEFLWGSCKYDPIKQFPSDLKTLREIPILFIGPYQSLEKFLALIEQEKSCNILEFQQRLIAGLQNKGHTPEQLLKAATAQHLTRVILLILNHFERSVFSALSYEKATLALNHNRHVIDKTTPQMPPTPKELDILLNVLLKKYDDIITPDTQSHTKLHMLASPEIPFIFLQNYISKYPPTLEELNAFSSDGFTPLTSALLSGEVEKASLLLHAGSDFYKTDEKGDFPLKRVAVAYGTPMLLLADYYSQLDGSPDSSINLLREITKQSNDPDLFSSILDVTGFPQDDKNLKTLSALISVSTKQNNIERLKSFAAHHLLDFPPSTEYASPLYVATEQRELSTAFNLLMNGAKITQKILYSAVLSEATDFLNLFCKFGADFNALYNTNNEQQIIPLLYLAITHFKHAALPFLLNHGANPNLRINQTTPLIMSVQTANQEAFLQLIWHGAYIGTTNAKNNKLKILIQHKLTQQPTKNEEKIYLQMLEIVDRYLERGNNFSPKIALVDTTLFDINQIDDLNREDLIHAPQKQKCHQTPKSALYKEASPYFEDFHLPMLYLSELDKEECQYYSDFTDAIMTTEKYVKQLDYLIQWYGIILELSKNSNPNLLNQFDVLLEHKTQQPEFIGPFKPLEHFISLVKKTPFYTDKLKLMIKKSLLHSDHYSPEYLLFLANSQNNINTVELIKEIFSEETDDHVAMGALYAQSEQDPSKLAMLETLDEFWRHLRNEAIEEINLDKIIDRFDTAFTVADLPRLTFLYHYYGPELEGELGERVIKLLLSYQTNPYYTISMFLDVIGRPRSIDNPLALHLINYMIEEIFSSQNSERHQQLLKLFSERKLLDFCYVSNSTKPLVKSLASHALAKNTQTLEELISLGFDINTEIYLPHERTTLLHLAMFANDMGGIEILTNHGINTKRYVPDALQFLPAAASTGNLEIFEMINGQDVLVHNLTSSEYEIIRTLLRPLGMEVQHKRFSAIYPYIVRHIHGDNRDINVWVNEPLGDPIEPGLPAIIPVSIGVFVLQFFLSRMFWRSTKKQDHREQCDRALEKLKLDYIKQPLSGDKYHINVREIVTQMEPPYATRIRTIQMPAKEIEPYLNKARADMLRIFEDATNTEVMRDNLLKEIFHSTLKTMVEHSAEFEKAKEAYEVEQLKEAEQSRIRDRRLKLESIKKSIHTRCQNLLNRFAADLQLQQDFNRVKKEFSEILQYDSTSLFNKAERLGMDIVSKKTYILTAEKEISEAELSERSDDINAALTSLESIEQTLNTVVLFGEAEEKFEAIGDLLHQCSVALQKIESNDPWQIALSLRGKQHEELTSLKQKLETAQQTLSNAISNAERQRDMQEQQEAIAMRLREKQMLREAEKEEKRRGKKKVATEAPREKPKKLQRQPTEADPTKSIAQPLTSASHATLHGRPQPRATRTLDEYQKQLTLTASEAPPLLDKEKPTQEELIRAIAREALAINAHFIRFRDEEILPEDYTLYLYAQTLKILRFIGASSDLTENPSYRELSHNIIHLLPLLKAHVTLEGGSLQDNLNLVSDFVMQLRWQFLRTLLTDEQLEIKDDPQAAIFSKIKPEKYKQSLENFPIRATALDETLRLLFRADAATDRTFDDYMTLILEEFENLDKFIKPIEKQDDLDKKHTRYEILAAYPEHIDALAMSLAMIGEAWNRAYATRERVEQLQESDADIVELFNRTRDFRNFLRHAVTTEYNSNDVFVRSKEMREALSTCQLTQITSKLGARH